jgi:hypothetical protein
MFRRDTLGTFSGTGTGPPDRDMDARSGILAAMSRRLLRHSFASLLLHEGRSVIYVARQLGHDARLTLGTYGHAIDELGAPQVGAEDAIRAARDTRCVHGVGESKPAAGGSGDEKGPG